MKKIRIGIVGLGYRIGYLTQVIAAMVDNFEFAGYVDPNPCGLPILEGKGVEGYGVAPELLKTQSAGIQYDSLDDMLDNEQIDLLMIGSPNHMHIEHIEIALKRGIKTFTEKPVVTTEEDTFKLLGLLKDAGGADQLMIGLVLRYAPLYRDLIKARDEGKLGDIASVEACEHIAPYHGAFFLRDWRRNSSMSGGFMLEKCCHDLDLYNGLMNCRPTKVASFGGRKSFVPENNQNENAEVYHFKPSGWNGADKVFDSEGDIIDNQTAILTYENGANMCFHTNTNVPDEFRRFAVIGSKGMAEGDFIRNFFKLTDAFTSDTLEDKSYQSSDLSVHAGADEQMILDIFAHIRDDAPLPVSILDGLEAGLTAIKIDEARMTGSVVDLTETWQKFDEYGLK